MAAEFTDISVVILAGQRDGVVDPLCAEAGTDKKAVIPIMGRPMLDYVLDALSAAGLSEPFHISGYTADHDTRLTQAPSEGGPAGSTLAAIENRMDYPVLVTTADHPLLTREMIEVFVTGARKTGADFCVGLAEKTIIQPAYPNVKRTYLKFADRPVSGCNLFYVANETGLEAIRFWAKAQQDRKRPLRLASRFGFRILWDYVTCRLTLEGAFAYASKRMNMIAKPVLIPIAEAAIDVDKPSDKILVEKIVSGRMS